MASVVDIKGIDKVMARLANLANRFPGEVARALYEELHVERAESMRRTPVDTGALRGSHQVEVEQEGREIVGRITVGGVAAPYAVWVHENLDAFHNPGQAKFLESTIMESKPFLAQRIARRIDLHRAAGA